VAIEHGMRSRHQAANVHAQPSVRDLQQVQGEHEMKTHYGYNNKALCECSILLAKATTTDPDAVDCLGCLWLLTANISDQLSRALNRVKVVSNEAINSAEYRLNPKVTT
jgi:hypothetical protein